MAFAFDNTAALDVLTAYNDALWPAPAALSLGAFAAVCLAMFRFPAHDRLASGLIATFWLWTGLLYCYAFLSRMTPLGYAFAFLFVVQAGLVARLGILGNDIRFWMNNGSRHLAGILLIFYALVAYPSLSALLGHAFPATPTFGTPTPVTIFTLGMLLLTRAPWPRILFAIPLLWTVVGTYFAIETRMREDLALIVAAALVLTMTPVEDDPDAAGVAR
ncbi:MAG TPA: DUF6064 family protein [Candidatus Limnocylindrales bacterium]|nr:DUF6064 family protein [Candidatus Limnocylindrales bacterium]